MNCLMNCSLLYPALPAFSNNRPCISHNYDCHSPSVLSQLFNFDIGGRPIFSKKVSFADIFCCVSREITDTI